MYLHFTRVMKATVENKITVRQLVSYLEYSKGGQGRVAWKTIWSTEVSSGVQGQSPGRGSGSDECLNFDVSKTVINRRKKLRSAQGVSALYAPPPNCCSSF